MKIPYLFIIGEKEVNEKNVAIREYKTKNQFVMKLDEFCEFTNFGKN
jgi:threonyl-tRNA synthetase